MKVFLTGASSGLGSALARRYAAEGAVLGLYARRADSLQQLAGTLAPATCFVCPGDVRDASSLRAAAHDFMASSGTPDVVVANAGVSIGTLTAHEDDNDAFRTMLDTNVLGMVHTFQPFLPAFAARKCGKLVGVAICGRPVSRRLDDGRTLKILRVATDGAPNACSFLYSRCAKIARLMGYERVITYTLESEGGASLRAVGARPNGPLESHEWGNPSRPRKSQQVYHEPKYRWEL